MTSKLKVSSQWLLCGAGLTLVSDEDVPASQESYNESRQHSVVVD
jgi:hypothetical protein